MRLYFDIDGVLNRCPQLGGKAPHTEPDCLSRFQQIIASAPSLELWCISFHRNYPEALKLMALPFEYKIARTGCYKRFAVEPGPHLIIDDQPKEYEPTHNVWAVDGKTGLTDEDVQRICARLLSTSEITTIPFYMDENGHRQVGYGP